MTPTPFHLLACLLPLLLQGISGAEPPRYEHRTSTDPHGTGKFYMGREISQVMGHRGAPWLDRPERESEENPEALLNALGDLRGMTVADIGAGSGYFSFRLAGRVGAGGRVLAVDIQDEMLQIIRRRAAQRKIENVEPIRGTIQDPGLSPESVDLALLVDVYHEFSHPWEMVQGIHRALKPGGRLVLVEYRAEDPTVPILRLHKMSQDQVRREISVHPLVWVETLDLLPRQHIVIFKRPAR
ncbi:MAG: class I SAM-dependent methyltransferase [Acidobacteriota bacterium]|nr:class I SAM-dependent methyltransferase [Acidobacteriota bacterium]